MMVLTNVRRKILRVNERKKSMHTHWMWPTLRGGAPVKPMLIGVLSLLAVAAAWGQIDRGTIQG